MLHETFKPSEHSGSLRSARCTHRPLCSGNHLHWLNCLAGSILNLRGAGMAVNMSIQPFWRSVKANAKLLLFLLLLSNNATSSFKTGIISLFLPPPVAHFCPWAWIQDEVAFGGGEREGWSEEGWGGLKACCRKQTQPCRRWQMKKWKFFTHLSQLKLYQIIEVG